MKSICGSISTVFSSIVLLCISSIIIIIITIIIIIIIIIIIVFEIVIIYHPGCDVIYFEINLIFLIKPFFLREQKVKTKI